MVTVDANLLIYAYDDASPFHVASAAWLRSAFEGTELIGLPLPAVMAFIRLTTSGKLGSRRFDMAEVLSIVDDWLALPHVSLIALSPEDWPLLKTWLARTNGTGSFSSDVQIAVLAFKYGATVYSADRDFARFPGLRWINPLNPRQQ